MRYGKTNKMTLINISIIEHSSETSRDVSLYVPVHTC